MILSDLLLTINTNQKGDTLMIGGVPSYNQTRDFFSKFKNNRRTGTAFTLPDDTRSNMTLEQYKQYIDDRISRMGSFGRLFIDISEEGYQAMKDDPEYEKAVLDKIQAEINAMENAGKGAGEVVHIGADEEQSWIERKLEAERTKTDKVDEDWWDRRMELMLENIRLNAAIRDKRAMEQKEISQELIFAERLNSAERQEKILKGDDPAEADIDKNSIYAKASMAAYLTGLLFRNAHII